MGRVWIDRRSPVFRALAGFLLLAGASTALGEVPGNRFVWTQLRHSGRWDPYPEFWGWAAIVLRRTTRLDPWPDRRVIGWEQEALFESPFLVVAGRGDWTPAEEDLRRLRDYLGAGGFLVIDDTEAAGPSAFARATEALPGRLIAGGRWRPVPSDHAVYRSFFLLSGAAGRRRNESGLKGFWMADRLVMVWSANDLMGALVRDDLGRPQYPCEPGGEGQRREAEKLFVNLAMFGVTGTYKTDAVHQPFLREKTEARP